MAVLLKSVGSRRQICTNGEIAQQCHTFMSKRLNYSTISPLFCGRFAPVPGDADFIPLPE
jgi:hypothetical protein